MRVLYGWRCSAFTVCSDRMRHPSSLRAVYRSWVADNLSDNARRTNPPRGSTKTTTTTHLPRGSHNLPRDERQTCSIRLCRTWRVPECTRVPCERVLRAAAQCTWRSRACTTRGGRSSSMCGDSPGCKVIRFATRGPRGDRDIDRGRVRYSAQYGQ